MQTNGRFQELDLSKEAFVFSESVREGEWRSVVAKSLHAKQDYKMVLYLFLSLAASFDFEESYCLLILVVFRIFFPFRPPTILSNLSLCLLYYAEACNEFVGPISSSLRWATQFLLKKCRSGGEL